MDDIYFLIGLSRRGERVDFGGRGGGGEPVESYIRDLCANGTRRQGRKLPIQHWIGIPLRIILYTMTRIAGVSTIIFRQGSMSHVAKEGPETGASLQSSRGLWSALNLADAVILAVTAKLAEVFGGHIGAVGRQVKAGVAAGLTIIRWLNASRPGPPFS